MIAFSLEQRASRVVFGVGTLEHMSDELDRAGIKRALVLSTAAQRADAQALSDRLGGRTCGIFGDARMHTPVETTLQAVRFAQENGADGLVAVGGGSTTGLAKAVSIRTGLPQIVAPTTYAGSEMTPILGETSDGQKRTRSDPRIQPAIVIYDVALTLTLPTAASVVSGFNAIAHAVEALYAKDRNPLTDTMAVEGISAFARALPRIVRDGADLEARGEALYGAWLCGSCLGAVGMALHHKLCHVLGGLFDLPHAEMHTIILPHALAYNAPAVPNAMAAVARALQVSDGAAGLWNLSRDLGAKTALKDIGFPVARFDEAVTSALERPYWNPREITEAGIRDLLHRAVFGIAPTPADVESEKR